VLLHHGNIQTLTQFTPRQHATVKLFQISQQTVKDRSLLPEAQRLQGIIARGDFTIAKTSISGTKYLLEKLYGYGGNPRKPLPPIEAADAEALWAHPHIQDLVKLERESGGQFIGK
jgi:4-hydroxy-2-oxoglutarate aldolase